MNKAFVFLLSFLTTLISFSQDSRVLVRNAPNSTESDPVVQIKWYSSQFPFYKEGAHVYRREVGSVNWERISTQPVKQVIDFDTTQYAGQNLGFFMEVVKQSTPAELEQMGFLLVNLLVKSFESQPFAEFLGITFQDEKITSGRTYEYRINRLVNGRETILGQSKAIRAGRYEPEPPVADFSVVQEDTLFLVDWSVDPEAFYGVNIYESRPDTLNGAPYKINERPLVVSEVTDSTGAVGYPSPKYKIDSLEMGKSYGYTLKGLDFFGSETAPAKSVNLTFRDNVPPMPPTDLSGKADSMKVHLKWQVPDDPGVKELRLYRSMLSDGPFEVVHTVFNETTYTDKLAVPGPYYYYLTSVDSSENEALSRKIFVEVQDVIPPLPPLGLTIAADTGRITLEWEANKEPDLDGYLVYRTVDRADLSNFVLLNSDPLKETRLVQELPKQVKNPFFYHIVAVDTSFNRSERSAFVSIQMPDVIAPERPHIKRISYEDELIRIEWVPNVDRDLMGYAVWRLDSLEDQEHEQVNVKTIAGDLTGFIDRSAYDNTEYFYQVVAMDSAGNVSEPSLPFYAYLKTKSDEVAEDLKVRLAYSQKKQQVVLRWQPMSEGQGPVLGYVIYASGDGEVLNPLTGLVKTTSYTDKKVEEPSRKYQVRAYTQSGQVIKSEVMSLE